MHPSDKVLTAGAADGRVRMYDMARFSPMSSWQAHSGVVTDMQWVGMRSLSGAEGSRADLLISGGSDGVVKLWDTRASTHVAEWMCAGPVGAIASGSGIMGPRGSASVQWMLAAASGPNIGVWDLRMAMDSSATPLACTATDMSATSSASTPNGLSAATAPPPRHGMHRGGRPLMVLRGIHDMEVLETRDAKARKASMAAGGRVMLPGTSMDPLAGWGVVRTPEWAAAGASARGGGGCAPLEDEAESEGDINCLCFHPSPPSRGDAAKAEAAAAAASGGEAPHPAELASTEPTVLLMSGADDHTVAAVDLRAAARVQASGCGRVGPGSSAGESPPDGASSWDASDEALLRCMKSDAAVTRIGLFGPKGAYCWAVTSQASLSLWSLASGAPVAHFGDLQERGRRAGLSLDSLVDVHFDASTQGLTALATSHGGIGTLLQVQPRGTTPVGVLPSARSDSAGGMRGRGAAADSMLDADLDLELATAAVGDGHRGAIRCVAWLDAGQVSARAATGGDGGGGRLPSLVTGGEDGRIILWGPGGRIASSSTSGGAAGRGGKRGAGGGRRTLGRGPPSGRGMAGLR